MAKKVSKYEVTVVRMGESGNAHWNKSIEADTIIYEGECIYLKLGEDTVGIYPARYTIIEKR
jgi:hypothetical protein